MDKKVAIEKLDLYVNAPEVSELRKQLGSSLLQLGNLALGALVFTQVFNDRIRLSIALIGIVILVFLYLCSIVILRKG